MVALKTVRNEKRCFWTEETHELGIENCCPVSHNPLKGSLVRIRYEPDGEILEVASLRAYVDSYRGGRGEVRSMEGMIQQIAQDAANALKREVKVEAALEIDPGQRMKLFCYASPLVP